MPPRVEVVPPLRRVPTGTAGTFALASLVFFC